jgi:UrcA family protein
MNSRTAFRPAVLLGAALAVSLLSSACYANDLADGTAVAVRYTQSELASTMGASEVYARIAGAARMVCGDRGRTLDEQRLYRSCYRTAVASAVADVHSPLLEAVSHEQSAPYTAMTVR